MFGSRSSDAFSSLRHISRHTSVDLAHANAGSGQVRSSADGVTQQDRAEGEAATRDFLLLLLLLLLLSLLGRFRWPWGVVSPLVFQLARDAASHVAGLRMLALLLTDEGLASG